MALVITKSDLYVAQTSSPQPDPQRARGVKKLITGAVANGASDSQNSKYILATIPSYAIFTEDTAFETANWGYANILIGTPGAPVALVNATKASFSGAAAKPIVFANAMHGKEAWLALGLAADPGGEIEISMLQSTAAATGAGTMKFQIGFMDRV